MEYMIFHNHNIYSLINYCRLDANNPKHGKEDPKNEPHVGGNTWAGGTGGRDTAGLGGKGGPYRLDKGHKVHQVTFYFSEIFINKIFQVYSYTFMNNSLYCMN